MDINSNENIKDEIDNLATFIILALDVNKSSKKEINWETLSILIKKYYPYEVNEHLFIESLLLIDDTIFSNQTIH